MLKKLGLDGGAKAMIGEDDERAAEWLLCVGMEPAQKGGGKGGWRIVMHLQSIDLTANVRKRWRTYPVQATHSSSALRSYEIP